MRQLAASKATSPGADPGIFDWWVLVQRGLSANTGRHWRGKILLCEQRRTDHRRAPKNNKNF